MPSRTTAATDAHKVDDIDELISFKEPLKKISFVRVVPDGKYSSRWLHVDVDPEGTRVSFEDADDVDLGAASRLDSLFMKRRQSLRAIRGVGFVVGGAPLVGWLIVKALPEVHPEQRWMGPVFIVLFASLANMAYALYDLKRTKRIKFRPEPNESKPIDWRSVAWAIGLLVIGSVITQVATAIRESMRKPAPPSVSSPAAR